MYVLDVQTYLRAYWFLPVHREVTVQSHLSLLASGISVGWYTNTAGNCCVTTQTVHEETANDKREYGWILTAGWINGLNLRTMFGTFPQASSKLPFTYPALWATSLWSLERVVEAGRLKVSRSLIVLELVVSCIMHRTRGSSAAFWIWKRIAKNKLHCIFKHQINTINSYKPCQLESHKICC